MTGDGYVLGIDVGTTGTKTLLVDTSGNVVASAVENYPLSTPRPLWSEQSPEAWWRATVTGIHRVVEAANVRVAEIAAVGLTGQMHGLVMLDDDGGIVRPAILWNDQRTVAQCERMHEIIGRDELIGRTGNPALTGFTAPKILWVREHEPDAFARVTRILLPKDYVRYRLTRAHVTDVADASGTCLLDVRRRAWSDDVIDALEIPRSWLPAVTESPVVSARVMAGSESGLVAGTPVVGGAGDQAAGAVGCGVVSPGSVSVTIGTSGVVFAATDEPSIDPAGVLHAFCHAAPGKWHLMGVMLSAGGSLRWYRDTLGEMEQQLAAREEADAYDVLLRDIGRVPPGCEGLLFLPYLTGERTPHADPLARGAFVGLTLRHTKSHMTRAVIEGITFGLADSLDLVASLGSRPSRIRIAGGGARSSIWRQIMADVFDAEIVTVNTSHGAAFGAAILALVGAGAYPGVEEAAGAVVSEVDGTQPGADVDAYRRWHERYRALYPALAGEFRRIADAPM